PNKKPTSGVLDFNRSRLKDLLIGSGMMFFYQFAGYTVVNNNINEILASGDLISFEEIRPENIASILISGAGLLGVILGLFLSIKANSRIKGKIIIMFSGIFSGLAFFMIGGAYYYRLDEEREDYTFLLLGTGSLVAHILFFSAGYGSICLPLIAQSQAPSARPLAMSVITTLGGAFAFLNAKSYYDLTALLGGRRDLSFFIYGLINLIGALYMAFAIKTKDR
ncbi:Trehalose transporter 12, partial [Caligus rogercresseyi]